MIVEKVVVETVKDIFECKGNLFFIEYDKYREGYTSEETAIERFDNLGKRRLDNVGVKIYKESKLEKSSYATLAQKSD